MFVQNYDGNIYNFRMSVYGLKRPSMFNIITENLFGILILSVNLNSNILRLFSRS